MKQELLRKAVTVGVTASMLAMSFPAFAATTVIKNFKVDRDTAVLDGNQYIAFNFDVLNPGADGIKLSTGAGTTQLTAVNNAAEFSGTSKWSAGLFPPIGVLGGGKFDYQLTSGAKKSAIIPVYIFKAIKFNSDMNLALSGGDNADSGETLLVKKGDVAGQTLTPDFSYSNTAPFSDANTTVLLLGKNEVAIPASGKINVTDLPAGKFKAVMRGYNYTDVDHKKFHRVDSSAYVNLTVLEHPVIDSAKSSFVDSETKISTTNKCSIVSADRGSDVQINFTAKNLTRLFVKVDGDKEYNIPTPNRTGVVYFNADCLTASAAGTNHTLVLMGENTSVFQTGASITKTVAVKN